MDSLVFIETRNIADLEKIIQDKHAKFLPDWEIMVVCSERNKHLFKKFNRMLIVDPVNSLHDYNHLLTSGFFWNQMPYEKVLICQHDSGLLKRGINEFTNYDYVGAPWKFQMHGGNGGLSLRNPKIMLEIINKFHYNFSCYEDVWFCNMMFEHGIGKLASRDICEKFSTETILKTGTLGYHAIENYHGVNACEMIYNQYRF